MTSTSARRRPGPKQYAATAAELLEDLVGRARVALRGAEAAGACSLADVAQDVAAGLPPDHPLSIEDRTQSARDVLLRLPLQTVAVEYQTGLAQVDDFDDEMQNAPADGAATPGEGNDRTNPLQEEGTTMDTVAQTPDHIAAIKAEMEKMFPPVDRPCPVWCERPEGHPWEGLLTDAGRLSRFHEKRISTGPVHGVTVTAEETAPTADCSCAQSKICDCPWAPAGPSTVSPPRVTVYDEPHEMDADTALALAADLRAAAIACRRYATATFGRSTA